MKTHKKLYILTLAITLIALPVVLTLNLSAQPTAGPQNEKTEETEELDFTIDATEISLETLMNIEVEVASLFAEDELVVGSTVASIKPEQWKRMGARRVFDTLINELGLMTYPTFCSTKGVAIRGYTTKISPVRGISVLVDGVPMNTLNLKTAFYHLPNWELGTLNTIEMIKGPGSAIYGEDAFHGVLSFKTFESKEDSYTAEAAGGFPAYTDGSIRLSHGIADDMFRIDLSAGASYQGDQKIENKYDSGSGFTYADIGGPESFPYAAGTNKRKDEYKSGTGVLKLTYNPFDKLKIRLNGYANFWDSNDFAGIGLYAPLDIQDNEVKIYMGKGSAVYTMENEISIEINGNYLRNEMINDPVFALNRLNNEIIINHSYYLEHKYAANLLIKQPGNFLNLQWIIGYTYTNMSSDEKNSAKFKGYYSKEILREIDTPYAGHKRIINGYFGQAKWNAVKEHLYIIAGARYDMYSDSGNQLNPRFSIIFLPVSNLSIKALYGRAFRALSSVELKGQGNDLSDPDLTHETIDCYEGVIIYKPGDFKISINGFYSEWHDTVELYDRAYTNTGDAYSMGGEADVVFKAGPLTVDCGLSYVKSVNLATEDYEGNIIDLDYHAFPQYSIQTGILYNGPWDILLYLNNRVYINWKEDPSAEADDLPNYWRTDLDISKTIADRLEIHLNGCDILNRKNRIPGIWHNNSRYTPYDSNGLPEDNGLSVLLRVSYKV